ncbi:MAG TPA: hypothetical protein VLM05_10260 [Mycobacteriales bacterium]|nr:hypothetical protein [Mycobacteriales bacterium]
MTEPQDDTTEDDLRRHAEPAVEGADDGDQPDQPREHTEDPAEG